MGEICKQLNVQVLNPDDNTNDVKADTNAPSMCSNNAAACKPIMTPGDGTEVTGKATTDVEPTGDAMTLEGASGNPEPRKIMTQRKIKSEKRFLDFMDACKSAIKDATEKMNQAELIDAAIKILAKNANGTVRMDMGNNEQTDKKWIPSVKRAASHIKRGAEEGVLPDSYSPKVAKKNNSKAY